jgi:signal transduction histidine kinase
VPRRSSALICLLLLVAGCEPPLDGIQHVTRAEVFFESLPSDTRAPPPETAPADAPWREVDLPFVEKDRQKIGLAQGRHLVRLWLRLPPTPPTEFAGAPLAVHYSGYVGPFWSTSLYVNGVHAGVVEHSTSNQWNQPVVVSAPISQTNNRVPPQIVLAIECYVGVLGCGAPSLYLGPQTAIARLNDANRFWRLDGPRIGSVAMLILGVFAFFFWLVRRREVVYALFALASLIWALRTMHYYLADYPGSGQEEFFWWMTNNSLSWMMVVTYVFAFRLHGTRHPWVERSLLAVAVLWSFVTLPGLGFDSWGVSYLTHIVRAVIAVGVTVLITVESVRRFSRELVLLAAALWVCIGFSIHDMLLQGWYSDIEDVFLLPYGALFLFSAFLFAIVRRYAAAILEVESVNASLETRLTARQAELEASYERLRAIERSQAEAAERQRLMREMHDGLGSSLMSSLVLVEQGKLDQASIARVLRECVDDLKLTIDSLEPMGEDLLTLLGTLRYRIGSRLEAAGLKLEWLVRDVPPLQWLNPAASLHILRILQESLTNVLKHASAKTICVETVATNAHVFVRVIDDGRGFDVASRRAAGRGLMNLKRRAEQIGGAVDVRSSQSGTTVELRLPIRADTP